MLTVDNFNNKLLEMTKHTFPAYTFHVQKRYLHRHQLHSSISRRQKMNANLEKFPLDTEDQQTSPLPTDEIMDIIYHSMPTMWKNTR